MKKTPRHLSRSLALQAIYHQKLNHESIALITDFLKATNLAIYNKADSELLHFILEKSLANFDTLLAHYQSYSSRKIDEIGTVEQIILVIAAVELIDNHSAPAPVVINEAIELAKLYGAADSYKFINGLVEKLAHNIRPGEFK